MLRHGVQLNAAPAPRSGGVTLLAWLLIASPLLQWAYISALSQFTILEAPYTTSRGLPLAMQIFFTSAGAIPTCLGVGLLYRSEWARRIACVVFAAMTALSSLAVGTQVALQRIDAGILVSLWSLALSAGCLFYFMRRGVRAEFRPVERSRIEVLVVPRPNEAPQSRPLVLMAWGEIMLGFLAVFLLAYLHFGFGTRPLLDYGPGIGVTEADELLRPILFATFALFLAPHALTTAASIGILLGRDTLRVARRYLVVACRFVVGAALVAAWLGWREGFTFETRSVHIVWAFCALSLAWHVRFLYILGHYGSAR
jgi:hypothetical protein